LLAVSLFKRQLTRALNGTKTVGFVRASQIIANYFCPLKPGVMFFWQYGVHVLSNKNGND